MKNIRIKALAVAMTALTISGCANMSKTECMMAGAAAGATATSGGDRKDIISGALGGAVLGGLFCLAMDNGNKDADEDGITNQHDQCPATPVNTSVDSNGCSTDLDNDGVINSLDQCPDTPANTEVDSTGCSVPTVMPQAKTEPAPLKPVDADKIIIIDDVHFEFNSSTPSEAGIEKLVNQTTPLKDNSELIIDVIGHADTVGTDEYNQKLSVQRAKAVIKALRQKGLTRATLNPIGMGESQPLVTGENGENNVANRKNRRVELRVRMTK